MSFDLTQNIITGSIKYNYYRTTFHKYQNTIENSGYIKVPYSSKINTPNLYFLENGYIATQLYIVRKIQVIDGLDYDATLVIEHRAITNQGDPVFLCIPLKTDASVLPTGIDDIISNRSDTDLQLNDYITSSSAVVYESRFIQKSNIIVLSTPILVASNFQQLRPGSFYIAPYNEQYSILQFLGVGMKNKTVEGFKEGATTTMAGYCQPVSEDDPTIGNDANYLVELGDPLIKDHGVNDSYRVMANFLGFFIIVLFTAFSVPIVYKYFFIELVLDNRELWKKDGKGYEESIVPQKLLNRLNALDMYTCAVFFMIAITYIVSGISNNNFLYSSVGFYLFLFFLVSLIVIQYQRIVNPNDFLKLFTNKPTDPLTYPKIEKIENDLGGFIMDNFNYLRKNLWVILLVLIIFGVLLSVLAVKKIIPSVASFMIPLTFISIYITFLVKHFADKYSKNKVTPETNNPITHPIK